MRVVFALFLVSLITGCGRDTEEQKVLAHAPSVVRVGEENIVRVQHDEIVTGPLVSGELEAAQEATVRAEVGGTVLAVLVDEGQGVRQGELLARIESRALEGARNSAGTAVQSADTAVAVAKLEVQRTAQLVSGGALAQQDLDRARANLASAEAQLATARAGLTSAEEQVGNTEIRAPLSGVVSGRSVGAGDVVGPGAEMFTIMDPSTMRLDASVSSDQIPSLRVGVRVQFDIRGYEEQFEGRIERINPRVDATTRQIRILVRIPNVGRRLAAGLFADGRVVAASAIGAIVASDAVNTSDPQPWVLRVREGRAERVHVKIGLRDDLTERLQIITGVEAGDILLRGAAQAITPGSAVDVGG